MVDSTVPMSSSLVQRMIRAAKLEPDLYEEVEADRTATRDAAIAVVIVGIASGIGRGLGAMMGPQIQGVSAVPVNPISAVLGAVISALIGWLIWSYVTYFIGTKLFSGQATPGEMLRTIGFAQSPGVFGILTFIPGIGPLIGIVVAIWSLVAGVVAVRQALDFTTGKAIMTTIIGWLVVIAITVVISLVIGGAVFAFTGRGGY